MSRLLASQITSEHLEMLFRLGDDFTNLIVTTGPLLPTSLVTIPDENLWFRHLEQKMHYRSRYLRGCKRSTSIRNRKYGDKMHWEASKWSIQHPQHPVCTYSKWLQENHEFSTSGSATSRMLQIKTLKKNLAKGSIYDPHQVSRNSQSVDGARRTVVPNVRALRGGSPNLKVLGDHENRLASHVWFSLFSVSPS